jgi:hypothetical protein
VAVERALASDLVDAMPETASTAAETTTSACRVMVSHDSCPRASIGNARLLYQVVQYQGRPVLAVEIRTASANTSGAGAGRMPRCQAPNGSGTRRPRGTAAADRSRCQAPDGTATSPPQHTPSSDRYAPTRPARPRRRRTCPGARHQTDLQQAVHGRGARHHTELQQAVHSNRRARIGTHRARRWVAAPDDGDARRPVASVA